MKQKHLLFPLLVTLVMMAMYPATMTALTLDSDGYYMIRSSKDLEDFRTQVNSYGKSINGKLTNNIDISNGYYTPIGTSSNPFTGKFNGQGFTITFSEAKTENDDFGLFGYVSNATITNLRVAGTMVVIGTKNHIGGIVAYLKDASTIKGCTFSGTLDAGSSTDCIGGIVGYAERTFSGSITNCFCNGTLKTTSTSNSRYIGGILGYYNDLDSNKPTIQYNFSDAQFRNSSSDMDSGDYINGIVGRIRAHADNVTLNTCIANGKVTRAMPSGNTNATIDAPIDATTNKPITINVSADSNGSVSKNYVYPSTSSATKLQVTATPNTSYSFGSWSDGYAQTHTVSLTSDVSLTATFAADQYTLTLQSNNLAGGTVSGGGNCDVFTDVPITATPNPGYHFINWTKDGTAVSTKASDNYRAHGNETLIANFHQMTAYVATAATCKETGISIDYWYCSACDKYYSDNKGTTEIQENSWGIPAKGHGNTNGFSASYVWSGTYDAPDCEFTLKCGDCNDNVVNPVSLTTTSETNGYYTKGTQTDPTCTAKGSLPFTANGKYTDPVSHKSYTETGSGTNYTHEYVIEMLNHDFSSKSPTETYKRSDATYTKAATYYYKCNNCEAKGTNYYESTEYKDRPTGIIASGTCGSLTWKISDNGTMTISGSGSMMNYNSNYDDSKPWKDYNSQIKKVVINEGVTSVGNSAFWGSTNITEVTLPESMEKVGENAFRNCYNIKKLSLGENCKTVGGYAFADCSALETVSLGNNLETIGGYAFQNCAKIRKLSIPTTLTEIKTAAFDGCNITSVYLYNIGAWCKVSLADGSSVSDRTKANPLRTAEHIYYCGDEIAHIEISEGVTVIKPYVFAGCKAIKSVSVPSSLQTIGDGAFSGCSQLCNVSIPSSCVIHSYGESCFSGCTMLSMFIITSKVTNIGNYAFYNCQNLTELYNLSTLNITSGATDYGGVAQYATIIHTNADDQPAHGSDGDYHFFDNGSVVTLTSFSGLASDLTLPYNFNGKTYVIGEKAFMGNKNITKVKISDGVTGIGAYAFMGCSNLSSLTISEGVTTIGDLAFATGSQLGDVCIPSTVTSIGTSVLGNATINNLTIPASLALTATTFSSCDINSASVTGSGGVTYISDGVLYSDNILIRMVSDATEFTVPTSVHTIACNAFSNRKWLKKIEITPQVTVVNQAAFSGCTSLADVIIDDANTQLDLTNQRTQGSASGEGLFNDCPLRHVYLGRNINHTGSTSSSAQQSGPSPFLKNNDGTSWSCPTMRVVEIGDLVTSVQDGLFSGCDNLKRAIIGKGISSASAFSGIGTITQNSHICHIYTEKESLTDDASNYNNINTGGKLHIDEDGYYFFEKVGTFTLTEYDGSNECPILPASFDGKDITLGKYIFSRSDIKSFTLPVGTQTIPEGMFRECANLKTIVIPSSVNSIGNYAFENCNMESIKCFATTPPATGNNALNLNTSACNLTVPAGTLSDYTSDDNWKCFSNITEMSASEQEPKQCATPIIELTSNGYRATCTTPDAQIHWSYGFSTSQAGIGTEIGNISGSIIIKAYATAEGFEQSATATKVIPMSTGKSGDIDGDDVITISDVTKLVNILLHAK